MPCTRSRRPSSPCLIKEDPRQSGHHQGGDHPQQEAAGQYAQLGGPISYQKPIGRQDHS